MTRSLLRTALLTAAVVILIAGAYQIWSSAKDSLIVPKALPATVEPGGPQVLVKSKKSLSSPKVRKLIEEARSERAEQVQSAVLPGAGMIVVALILFMSGIRLRRVAAPAAEATSEPAEPVDETPTPPPAED